MDRIEEEQARMSQSCSSETIPAFQKCSREAQDHAVPNSSGKQRHSDRFVPFRWDDDSKNFFELSCSLDEPEEPSTSSNTQAIEGEDDEKYKASYSSLLAKKMFNFQLNFSSPNVIDHENQSSFSPEMNSSPFSTGLSTLLGGSSTGVGSGLSFSGAFTKPNGLTNSSSSNLVLSRGFEPNGLGKILKYRSSLSSIQMSKFSLPVISEEDSIDFECSKELEISKRAKNMEIYSSPMRILEAPGLRDDFYYNLIDWGKKNIMAVSLSNKVYLWNALTSQVAILGEVPGNCHYTSTQWNPSGSLLSTGTSTGVVEVWDLDKMKRVQKNLAHSLRVGNMQWISENVVLSSSRDRTIALFDLRANCISTRLRGHKQEVCGLSWSPGCELLASGGNEYRIHVWSLRKDRPVCSMSYHKSAVKALDWNPRQRGILLSGGGNSDKTIKVFNTATQKLLKEVNVGNQVCNIHFSKHSNYFVSTHGFTKNDISLWNYETLEQTAQLEGHLNRVLYMCSSPDEETIATAAGDEVIKFWKVFPREKKLRNKTVSPSHIFLR